MALFDDVFNPDKKYYTLFFNLKTVLIYPNLEELKANDNPLYQQWNLIAKTKHSYGGGDVDGTYSRNAPNYPEFNKIVAITYATMYLDGDEKKRSIHRLVDNDEFTVLSQFIDVLHYISNECVTNNNFLTLCGHNIIASDIPILIKRFLVHSSKLENKKIPYIIKRSLNIKPWESGVIDTLNVWKFNGFENMPLMTIAESLGLKKTVDLLPSSELSEYYWNNIKDKPDEVLKSISLQSATQVNLVIQMIDKLSDL